MTVEAEARIKSIQEEVDGVQVGQTILFPRRAPISERIAARSMLLELAERGLNHSYSLHNNTPLDGYYRYPTERPASAYYTYDPAVDLVILEWGLIQDGYAKLHTYLNRVVNYRRRTLEEGMTLISGHIAQIKNSDFSFALLDSLSSGHVAETHPSARTVEILQQNQFLVMSSNGELCF